MKLIKKIIKLLLKIIVGYETYEKQIFLEGIKTSLIQKKIKKIKDFSDIEFSVFSQWGDDGIINWLLENIPFKNNIFIEIGTEDYKESNTRFLMMKRNWSGYLIEANKLQSEKIKKQSIYWKYDLNIINAFIDRENVNNIIKKLNLPKEIGLLSLDIDGNDYWVWEQLNIIQPIIFICEYNAVFGDINQITTPYKKKFSRTSFHYSNLAFGGSIKAFEKLSIQKGYVFLGTNSNGVNAYFIKKKYFKYIKSKLRNYSKYPSKIRESRNKKFKKNYLKGIKRKNEIENVNLIKLKNKKSFVKLKDLKKIYSKEWSKSL